jgi:hypothetical protein
MPPGERPAMLPHMVLPTEANLRFYRRLIACSLAVALLSFVVALAVLQFGAGRGGRSPAALLLSSIAFVGAIVLFRRTADTLEQQLRQLRHHGRRFPVEQVRTARMRRGDVTHWHVVIATWRDHEGRAHEALSDPFHYDPAPLLERDALVVLADPFEPALCLVLADGLPPVRRARLDPAQRARVDAYAPAPPLLALLRAIAIVVAIAMAVYVAVKVIALLQD